MKLVWTDNALNSLENIFFYIFIDNPDAAERVVDSIEEKAEFLKQNPLMGRISGFDINIRELIIVKYPYKIHYIVRGDLIEILDVYHDARYN